MIWQDTINGIYELSGSLFILLHCLKLLKDKKVRGVSIIAITFFVSWGIWNLYYYPFLNQWCSFIGGIGVVSMNCFYVILLIYYILKEKRKMKNKYNDPIKYEDFLDFYFYVWCEQFGYTQANPWKVQQIVAQDKNTAALLFIDWYDERNPYTLADIITKDLIIHVQDWRGVITKFEIEEIKTKYNYILREI